MGVPYGQISPTEGIAAAPNGVQAALEFLRKFRTQQQSSPTTSGPAASLFGTSTPSLVSRPLIKIDDRGPIPFLIEEWAGEAAGHIWLVRAAIASVSAQGDQTFTQSLSGLSISAVSQSSTGTVSQSMPRAQVARPVSGPKWVSWNGDSQQSPKWWSGACDLYNYQNSPNNPNHIPSFAIATWNGITACGPNASYGGSNPTYDTTPTGASNQIEEWQCVELTKRYLFIGYPGVDILTGNGSQVVTNYTAAYPSLFHYVANGTANQAPTPGDVLSFGALNVQGHTALVTSVDQSTTTTGTGYINYIEENGAANGTERVHMTNWWWDNPYLGSVNWLHPIRPNAPGAPVQSWAPYRMDLFFKKSSDNSFWHRYGDGTTWTGGTSWTEDHLYPIVNSQPMPFASQPIVVSWGPNRLDIVGIAQNGVLYHQWWGGTSWGPAPPPGYAAYQGWQPLNLSGLNGVTLIGNPAVTTWGTNRLDIFARDTNGALWHVWYAPSTWSVESILTGTSSDPAAASWGQNRLDVFAQRGGNYTHADWGGSVWSSEDHGPAKPGTSFASAPSMTSTAWNTLDIVGLGNDGNLYHQSWNSWTWLPGPSYTNWEQVTNVGVFTGTPAIASWASNRLDVFVLDLWHAAWHIPYDYGWGPLESHGGVFNDNLIANSWGVNRLDALGRGQDNGMWWQYWQGSNWIPTSTSWASLGAP